MRSRTTSILLSLIIILIPLFFLGERLIGESWRQPLVLPTLEGNPPAGTQLFSSGTLMPTTIDNVITFTAADNPVLVRGTVEINRGAAVIFQPGTSVVADEFASISVLGSLTSQGTADEPTIFSSNMVHPDEQTWSGILAHSGSQVSLTHTTIRHAAPALSCLPGSAVRGTAIDITQSLVGFYDESDSCVLTDSRIQAITDGVVSIGGAPTLTNTDIAAGNQAIRTSTPAP